MIKYVFDNLLYHRHYPSYNPKRLSHAELVKIERRILDHRNFYGWTTENGRIKEAEYERRKAMSKDLFTKQEPTGLTKNETDIALLRRCIKEKWIPIYEGKTTDRGSKDCFLCGKYEGCEGCPIFKDTGYTGCRSTPYYDFWIEVAGINQTANTPEKKLAALQELVYLEGLIARLTKAEEEEKEKQAAAARTAMKAKIEKERQIYHPLVFYIALKEPTVDALSRVHLQRDLITFLKERGLKVRNARYSFGSATHLMLNPKNGEWSHEGDVSTLIK